MTSALLYGCWRLACAEAAPAVLLHFSGSSITCCAEKEGCSLRGATFIEYGVQAGSLQVVAVCAEHNSWGIAHFLTGCVRLAGYVMWGLVVCWALLGKC